MKKAIAILISVLSFAAMAETVTLLETNVPTRTFGRTYANAKFFMDTTTNQGYADITVTEENYGYGYPGRQRCDRWGCYPMPDPIPTTRVIFSTRVEVPNLTLVDKNMLYRGINGEVNCGKLGTSRVLRRPTLYLSGNCSLGARLRGQNLTVSFNAK